MLVIRPLRYYVLLLLIHKQRFVPTYSLVYPVISVRLLAGEEAV